MEVAGKSVTAVDPIEIGSRTLLDVSGLLRDLLEQIDASVDVIREH